MSRYISDTPREKTILGIEATVEWVEAQKRPFTTHDAMDGAQFPGHGYSQCPTWSTVYRTIRDLEHYGLIVRVNHRDAKPALWTTIDRKEPLDGRTARPN
ncbi:hypothetical protein [Amycolatopsis sp. NPDC059657]|uniref:hypothetical protein n=1 Tax=Amycolatopsis sp. NPDC059657 TaxID=3346899 RepID=UPI00366C4C3E